MKKIILLSQILLFTFALNAFPKLVQAEEVIGKVLAVQGTIEYRRGTTPVAENKLGEIKTVSFTPWEKVKFGQAVYKTDEFKTARVSRLKIKFNDNSLIALGPNATMKVQSYVYNSKQKLRQATISVAKGLAMYIINKSQKNKKSRFKMVSPIGNIASRGTHGYFAVGTDRVLVANQAGAVESSNSDPNVVGSQTIGAMEKTIITEGNPPLPPVPLTNNEVSSIRNLVLGRVGTSASNLVKSQSLIAVDDSAADEEGDQDSDSSDDSSSDSKKSPDSKGDKGGPDGGDGSGPDFGIGDLGGFGGPEDFAQVNDPFNAAPTVGCTK
jgi:hypothetical protein